MSSFRDCLCRTRTMKLHVSLDLSRNNSYISLFFLFPLIVICYLKILEETALLPPVLLRRVYFIFIILAVSRRAHRILQNLPRAFFAAVKVYRIFLRRFYFVGESFCSTLTERTCAIQDLTILTSDVETRYYCPRAAIESISQLASVRS